ncbi:MAG TPA: hypothetical protein VER17_05920 [Tepidisphaeraceae bacterium]|nr:hypothetical protein [Tepidisphaeraceae bacterium]
MAKVKTAISVPRALFEEIERYSRRHRISRSEVFAEGAMQLLREKRNRRVTEKLDQVYGSPADDVDVRAWQQAAARSLARLLKDDQW